MGWTHDYRDVSHNRRAAAALGIRERGAPDHSSSDPSSRTQPLGIPHILRRRARWVSARLRHPRN
ncbi:hypothetical protein [Streptomyces sp. H27-D2]|uniref:hypothetical protein n=1 Tax=Streptomyces sp. H27-D2 TaxID=3046304 RepID=UPI002DBACA6B|nr:hypothetical protein [Streptomyces sp. H27-D2]MEC4014989.1 hypothetical protein [Streptomyces sp. H27-D2]